MVDERDGALIAFGFFCQSNKRELAIKDRFPHDIRSSSDVHELDMISWLSSEQAQRSSLVPRFVNLLASACS